MQPPSSSRRSFFKQSGNMLSGAWLTLQMPAILATANFACQAHSEGADFEFLSLSDAADLEAIASRIIPTDDTPGAREAGVVYFMDRALMTFMAEGAEELLEELHAFQADVRASHNIHFAELDHAAQTSILQGIEESDFFGNVRSMTLMGMFAHPSYGGNRDKIGWTLLGFNDRHVWQPPFGYYDDPDNQ